MELFHQLGDDIERQWLEQDYNEAVFPTLAAEALRRHDLPSKLTAWDVLAWTMNERSLPRQQDISARFGDPPITIYLADRFYIDVYFWFQGTTATHQHGFCGAFQVLHGSSIHSWYEFERRDAVNAFCEIGDIKLKVCEILELGAIQEINWGRQYIHSLFHIDQPSATIVVRTDRSPLELPQFSYYKPSLAIDPFFEQDQTTKKMQAMAALIHSKRDEADALITEWLKRADFHTAYMILAQLRSMLRTNQLDQMFRPEAANERFAKFLNVAAEKHGERGRELLPIFARMDTLDEIIQRRGYVTKPEHRFFMALLLNVDGRERIFDLILQRFPDADPQEKVLDWVFDLSQTRLLGTDNSNALGIPGFGEPEMFALEQMLKGTAEDEIPGLFIEENPGSDISAATEAIARLRSSVIFSPLLG